MPCVLPQKQRLFLLQEISFTNRPRMDASLHAFMMVKDRATETAASNAKTKMPLLKFAAEMDYLTRVTVRNSKGPAPFDRIRVETPSGLLAEVHYEPGKSDPYILQYRLKKSLAYIRLVLIDEAGEHPVDILPGSPSYQFNSTISQPAASSGGGIDPLHILNLARQAVPAVNYALGVAGISAAGAIVTFFLGWTRASVVLIALIFVGMLLLFLFSQLAVARDRTIQLAGAVLLWAVLLFFVSFLGFTVTAFALLWPPAWADFLGIQKSLPSGAKERLLARCAESVHGRQYDIALDRCAKAATDIQSDFMPFHYLEIAQYHRGQLGQAINSFKRALTSPSVDEALSAGFIQYGLCTVEVSRSAWGVEVS